MRRSAQINMRRGAEVEYLMTPGGACESLPPQVFTKYFYCNNSTEPFLSRTAKRICARCPVQELCLEQALKAGRMMKSNHELARPGVVGGMTTHEIYRIQEWEAYDAGLRETPPKDGRVKRYKRPPATAGRTGPEPRVTVPDLSYEERVYLIFREVKEGKYKTLNDAVRDIAALHDADVLSQADTLGRPKPSILNYDLRRMVKRPGLNSYARTRLAFTE